MSTFAEEQTRRDTFMSGLPSLPIGDECRRWSTCDRCGWTSPEMRFLTEQIGAEDDHAAFGCDAKADLEPIDVDLDLFPYPEPWTFTRRLEELVATIHVYRPANPAYTSGRTPAAPRRAA